MKVLVIDIGGTNVKVFATGHKEPQKIPSGPALTPDKMVAAVKELAADWDYEAVSIGVPGQVMQGQLILDPPNLGPGWVEFDFNAAFGVPVKLVNDAAMQALGSYRGGKMMFFGLGTGLGAALVVNGIADSREIAHLRYKRGTYEDYVGKRALLKLGKKCWRKNVEQVVKAFLDKVHADDVVLGGGNTKKLKSLPKGCRAVTNANALLGGLRLWEKPAAAKAPTAKVLELAPRGHNQSAQQSRGKKLRKRG